MLQLEYAKFDIDDDRKCLVGFISRAKEQITI